MQEHLHPARRKRRKNRGGKVNWAESFDKEFPRLSVLSLGKGGKIRGSSADEKSKNSHRGVKARFPAQLDLQPKNSWRTSMGATPRGEGRKDFQEAPATLPLPQP
ncbi:hypothetical protein KM043_005366 [Ampulex compressa]|nr:hypothetical protein KM043_005366 [Ampulex compressa]